MGTNLDQIQQSFDEMAKELVQVRAHSEQQASTILLLLDEVNLLAGFVGTPGTKLATPNLWQAASTTYNWLLKLQTKLQGLPTGQQSDLEELFDALEHDHKARLCWITLLEAKQEESARQIKNLITIDQLKEFLPHVIQEELMSKLRKIEPLLLRTQHFLDNILPSLSPTASIQINKGEPGLSGGGGKTHKDLSLQEFKELASAIQSTQAEQAIMLHDLQVRAEDSVVDIEGKCFPSLSFVTTYVNSNNIAPHCLKMVDAMLLLEMVTSMSQNFADNIDSQF